MENGKKQSNIILFLVCLFLGWFGLDKIYVGKGWKLAVIKFILCFIIVGIVWNIYDMVYALLGKYEPIPGFLKK